MRQVVGLWLWSRWAATRHRAEQYRAPALNDWPHCRQTCCRSGALVWLRITLLSLDSIVRPAVVGGDPASVETGYRFNLLPP